MKIISAVKNNKLMYGNVSKISEYVGMDRITLGRHLNEGTKVYAKNDYVIYLDCEKI